MNWDEDLEPAQRDLLEHPLRRAIVEVIARRPGVNKSQIAGELGIHLALAIYHLDRLVPAGTVALRPSPRNREVVCFLARDLHLWENPRTRVLFGGSPVAAVARHVAEQPGATAREISEALGLTAGAVHHHLRTLLSNGLVQRFRLGSEYKHYPRDELKRWAAATTR